MKNNIFPAALMIFLLISSACHIRQSATAGAFGNAKLDIVKGKAVDNSIMTVYMHRSGLKNSRSVFEKSHKGRVAFLGGSITQAFVSGNDKAWRDHVMDMLQARFPRTKFDFINAGVGGTNSTLGAYRLEEDVFGRGKVDLLFVEFAVNDAGGEPGDVTRLRAMEGIVRHARELNPEIDILVQYLAYKESMADFNAGKMPAPIADHDAVARHYDLPAINQAADITRRVNDGEFAWEKFGQDTAHPTVFGHSVYGDNIQRFLDEEWSGEPAEKTTAYPMPPAMDAGNLEKAHFMGPEDARVVKGWKMKKGWLPEKTCNFYRPVDALIADGAGAELELTFTGCEVGIYDIVGFDTGVVEYSVDGGAMQSVDLFDGYCTMFYRPMCYVFAKDLADGKHVLRLKMNEKRNEKATGNSLAILKFCIN